MKDAFADPASRAGATVTSQTEKAVAVLKEKVLSNELLPGSNHLESELADMLNMSRTPVREALLVLEAQGLVEIRPRRGVRVLPLSAQDMKEIYQLLTELESMAAAEVAAKGLSRQELAIFEDCLKKMEDALEADDRTSWAEADAQFHRKLVKLAGNRRLEQVVQMFSDQVHRARLLTLQMRPPPHRSNQDHRALVEAISKGDIEEARRVHREHRIMACELIVSLLNKHGLSQV